MEAGIAVGYVRLGVVRRPGAASNNDGENIKKKETGWSREKAKIQERPLQFEAGLV